MAANSTQYKDAPEGYEESITHRDVTWVHRKIIALLAAALLFIGTYTVNIIINSPHSRIDNMVDELTHVHSELEGLKSKVQKTQRNDKECAKLNIKQQTEIDMLKEISADCLNWRSKAEEEIIQLQDFYRRYRPNYSTRRE